MNAASQRGFWSSLRSILNLCSCLFNRWVLGCVVLANRQASIY